MNERKNGSQEPRRAVGPTLTFSREMLLTLPYQAALAEPRHHVCLGYGQEVGLRSSLGSGSSGMEADCGGPILSSGGVTVNFGCIK